MLRCVNENRSLQARQSYPCWSMDSHSPMADSFKELNV
jgi:hypothetical protein